MKKWVCLVCVLFSSLISGPVSAVEQIVVEALFPDKAMVSLDGKRRLLKLNKPSPEGVLLISATSKQAVIEIDGKRETYMLGGHITTRFTKPDVLTAKVWRNQAGAYTTVGTVNGLTVKFLMDTGATAVAMSSSEAKRLGISYRVEGNPINVNTANGAVRAYDVVLDCVQVGDIILRSVRGFVIDSAGPARVLLGMSFLNQVKMENQGDLMLLKQHI